MEQTQAWEAWVTVGAGDRAQDPRLTLTVVTKTHGSKHSALSGGSRLPGLRQVGVGASPCLR